MEYHKTSEIRRQGQLYGIWVRFRRNKLALIGLIVFLLIVFGALFADLFIDYRTAAISQNISQRLQKPSAQHIFGTDMFGRDLFARIVFGSRYSLGISMGVMFIALVSGVIIGSTAGYYGGTIDGFIMRIIDVFLSLPSSLLAIAVVAALGQRTINIIIALSITQIPRLTRVVRSVVLPLRGHEYIEAAISNGASNKYIIGRHILPNAIGPIIVQTTLNVSFVILTISGLGFIGLGVPPPAPEWGSMAAQAQPFLRDHPYLAIIPGIAICICAMSLNLVGDGLRDALDPKLKN